MSEPPTLRGTVHGKTIELDEDAGLPEGQSVSVVLRPLPLNESAPIGEGLSRSFGAWVDDVEGLDKYLEWNRHRRKHGRPGTEM